MTEQKQLQFIESAENLLPQLYQLFGFIELHNYMKTEKMKFSKFTLLKIDELIQFIIHDYEDTLIAYAPNRFLDERELFPKLEKTKDGQFQIDRKQLLKFIGFQIYRIEAKLHDLRGGIIGSMFRGEQ